MAFDRDGNLWTASAGGGVVRWDPTDGTYTRYTVDDDLADNSVYSIAVAPDGALWFGTGKGVSRFDGGRLPLRR
jgi:streptogramin lyase